MFNINEIPIFIKPISKEKYDLSQDFKRKIRMLRFSDKKTKKFIIDKFKISLYIVNKILKEST